MKGPDNKPRSLGTVPFKPTQVPLCQSAIRKYFPDADEATISSLGTIWDEVVHLIIQEMMALALASDKTTLHIDILEDMVLELAQLQLWLGERVVEKRTIGRPIDTINPVDEREACLGPDGGGIINGTARLTYDHIWKRKMEDRWKPKSTKAIEREQNPRKTTLAIKPVGKNHFISKWFIKDNWATNGKVRRWRRTDAGWSASPLGFGEWGYRHNLYSDRLEAYFSLLEGDAKRPIEMLLDTRPLNHPQRDALVGFLIIHVLRNPHFIEKLQNSIAPVIASSGHADDSTMPGRAYESMFKNNAFYDQVARPILWSRWAIVKSQEPVFVLPDTFGIRGDLGDGLRMIVPLTPTVCFVTLLNRESEKRVVPRFLPAEDALARRISASLLQAAEREFISHPEFMPDQTSAQTLGQLLNEIGQAIAARDDDEG